MALMVPEVVTVLMIDGLLTLFGAMAFVVSLGIVRHWREDEATSLQYRLQKRAYLVGAVVAFVFYLKLPLFLFFIHTLDNLAGLLPGAMCAAGVTDATVYGTPLFIVKLFNLYLFGFWLTLHRVDLAMAQNPYTRVKFLFFLLLFPMLALEYLLEFLHFSGIDPHVIVSCCGTLFSASKTSAVSYALKIPSWVYLAVFYALVAAMIAARYRRAAGAYALLNLLFVPISIFSLIAVFSTYVYEMPHHHCPFCLLQSDYGYVGYLLYAALFGGTFWGMGGWLLYRLGRKRWRRWIDLSMAGNLLYVALVSYYPVAYYLKNGVWL